MLAQSERHSSINATAAETVLNSGGQVLLFRVISGGASSIGLFGSTSSSARSCAGVSPPYRPTLDGVDDLLLSSLGDRGSFTCFSLL